MSLVMDDGWDGDSEGVYIDVLLAVLLTIVLKSRLTSCQPCCHLDRWTLLVCDNTNGQRIEPRNEADEPPDEQGQGPIYKANNDGLVPRSNDIPILFELHAGEIQPA